MAHGRKIAVIGLGYVGLPVAVAFARSGVPVIGFDIDAEPDRRTARRPRPHARGRAGRSDAADAALCERSGELEGRGLLHRHRADADRRRATGPICARCSARRETVGSALKRGDIVVYEFDRLSRRSRGRLRAGAGAASRACKAGSDFTVGYSPERINPGDKEHRFETIIKVVAGQDARTLDIVADVYGSVVTAGIHRAPSIKVAEAAKVIENTQRDLNIAFMNELSAICHQLGIDTGDVLAAAGTKWNFLNSIRAWSAATASASIRIT